MASANSKDGQADASALFAGAMPKGIGALEFLKNHSEYDGRGVILAVLDTGVDPGAAGLQVTSDGKPKILDILDCTGSGDIDTSKIVKTNEDGTITGHFDTPLKLNPDWSNPSGEWHVGYKRAYDLFAGGLRRRITKERRKRLDEEQRVAVAAATKELAEAQAAIDGAKTVTQQQKKDLEEKEARLKLLHELLENYKDPGPLIHAVVWNDGNAWRTALDTSDIHSPGAGKGLLADHAPLADFALDREFATFSAEDACNYGVHVYNDGNLLSVVVECGSHGTHVAGIAAAYHPDEPHLNGIAPGAQIVSMKIGDSRLDGMETNVGLSRALIDVLRHKADLINLSYGEATSTPNSGRFIELANEVVNEHGVIFISSAGNAGPALSTVGAPGGTSSSIVSVGAYVSPELAAAGHSVRITPDQGQQYTWSSRGPTQDGDGGVSISAPGGAIAPVPQWTQQSRQLMNGTSMASPCACGGFALLLSGLKAEGRRITPTRVRRAVENTALPVNESVPEWPLTYGRGLLQVHKAFDLLTKAEDSDFPDVRYALTVKRSGSEVSRRGIYLRDPADVAQPSSHAVEVLPKLKEGVDVREECLRVEDKLLLRSTAPWATSPGLLLLPFNGRSFEIKVDPSDLAPGVHYAEVQAFDSAQEWRGPLFRVPITVIKTLGAEVAVEGSDAFVPGSTTPTAVDLGTLTFTPGTELRRFLHVPEGAAWGELQLRAGAFDTPKTYMIRATHLLPHTRYTDTEMRQTTALSPTSEAVLPFKVTGGAAVELTLAQFWSSLGDSSLQARIVFHGLEAPASIALDGTAGVAKFLVRAPFRREKLSPSGKLTHLRIPLRPNEAQLLPLTAPRDDFPRNRLAHTLLLSYKLKVEEPGSYRPSVPMLDRYVYDGVVEAQMAMVYDGNKKLLGVGDVYPAETTLQKGDHTIRLSLRHDDPQLLEKFRDLPLLVTRKLKDSIAVNVHTTNSAAVKGDKPVKDLVLAAGERRALFVALTNGDAKLPKDATPGRILAGKLQLGKLSELAGGKDAPSSTELLFTVPPKKETKEGPKIAEPEAESISTETRLAEKLRDASVAFLEESKAPANDTEAAALEALAQKVLKDFPGHLPVLLWQLKRAEAAASEKKDSENEAGEKLAAGDAGDKVVAAASKVLAAVDLDELAEYLAHKSPEEGPGAETRKQQMEERKAAVIAAYLAAAKIHVDRAFPKLGAAEAPQSAQEKLEEVFRELRKWVDVSEAQYATLVAKREASSSRYATAIKALQKASSPSEKPAERAALELQIKLLEKLGWAHWQRAEQSRLIDAFPPAFRPF